MLGLNTSEIANGKIYATINIVSPLKGTISLVEANIGSYVEPLTKLFEVVNNEQLHADFRVYEKDISKITLNTYFFIDKPT
jgi:cobalt-zinc-cadmium efflux system membrane fusion protein